MASQCPHPAAPAVLSSPKKMGKTICERRKMHRQLAPLGSPESSRKPTGEDVQVPVASAKSSKVSDSDSKVDVGVGPFDNYSDIKETDEEATIFYTKYDHRTMDSACRVPPPAFWKLIPDFNDMGPDNCGNHEWDVSPEDHIVENGIVKVCCRDCRRIYALRDVHMLPCKHMLCLSCLCRAVQKIVSRLNDKKRFKRFVWYRQICCGMHEGKVVEEEMAEEETMDKDQREYCRKIKGEKSLIRHRGAWKAMEKAGYICRDDEEMELWDHCECLPPRLAQALWLAENITAVHPRYLTLRCGWPDCRQFVSHETYITRDNGEDEFYCVNCGGHSLLKVDPYTNALSLMPTYEN